MAFVASFLSFWSISCNASVDRSSYTLRIKCLVDVRSMTVRYVLFFVCLSYSFRVELGRYIGRWLHCISFTHPNPNSDIFIAIISLSIFSVLVFIAWMPISSRIILHDHLVGSSNTSSGRNYLNHCQTFLQKLLTAQLLFLLKITTVVNNKGSYAINCRIDSVGGSVCMADLRGSLQ